MFDFLPDSLDPTVKMIVGGLVVFHVAVLGSVAYFVGVSPAFCRLLVVAVAALACSILSSSRCCL